jgi:hypothetical protein
MTLEELLEGTRYIVDDLVVPYQWSSEILTRYLNEAVDLLARRTFCLVDSEDVSTRLTTVAGQTRYELDPTVLTVVAVEDAEGIPLRPQWSTRRASVATGKPRGYSTRPGPRALYLWPTPDDAYEFQMLVARRPASVMTNLTDEPEIPEEFHLGLCDFAAYRAWMMADPDGVNLKAGLAAQARWDLHLRDAKRELYQFTTMGSVPYVLRRGV